MATFSKNPRRFTGTEKMVVDALVLKQGSTELAPELRLPFASEKEAESLKAKVWAYVRAMEAMVDLKAMKASGHQGSDAQLMDTRKMYIDRAFSSRHFTTRKVPSDRIEGGTDLVFYLAMNRAADQAAVDYLADQIATMTQEQEENGHSL